MRAGMWCGYIILFRIFHISALVNVILSLLRVNLLLYIPKMVHAALYLIGTLPSWSCHFCLSLRIAVNWSRLLRTQVPSCEKSGILRSRWVWLEIQVAEGNYYGFHTVITICMYLKFVNFSPLPAVHFISWNKIALEQLLFCVEIPASVLFW